MTSVKLSKYTHQISVFVSENLFIDSNGNIVFCSMKLPKSEIERRNLSHVSAAYISENTNKYRILIFTKNYKLSLRELMYSAWTGENQMVSPPHEILIDCDAIDYSFVDGFQRQMKDLCQEIDVGLSQVSTHKQIKSNAKQLLNNACKDIISRRVQIKSFHEMRDEINAFSLKNIRYSSWDEALWHEEPIKLDQKHILPNLPSYFFEIKSYATVENDDFKLPPEVFIEPDRISAGLSNIIINFRQLNQNESSEEKLIKNPSHHWLSTFLSCITDNYKNSLIRSISKELCVLFIGSKCAVPMTYAQNLRAEIALQNSFLNIKSVNGLNTCMDCLELDFQEISHYAFHSGKALGFNGFVVFRKRSVFSVFMIKSETAIKYLTKKLSTATATSLEDDKIEVMTKLLRLYETAQSEDDIDPLFFAVENLLDGASSEELDDIVANKKRDINLSLASKVEIDDTVKNKALVYDIVDALHFGGLTNSDLLKIEAYVTNLCLKRGKDD